MKKNTLYKAVRQLKQRGQKVILQTLKLSPCPKIWSDLAVEEQLMGDKDVNGLMSAKTKAIGKG